MRVLLQQKDSGRYFKAAGLWTVNPGEAMDFLCSTKAIDYCTARRISGVQIVLKFDQQAYDIVLPIEAAKRSAQARAGES